MTTEEPVEIRLLDAEQALHTAFPLLSYAFEAGPPGPEQLERWRADLPHRAENTYLVAFVSGRAVACVVGMPMSQNVRGRAVPMLGVSGVATHPAARRRGHVTALMNRLHTHMRDQGCVVASLYPFRASFYERFGYAGLPQARAVRLDPRGLAGPLRADVAGEVSLHRIGEAYDEYDAFCERIQASRHGFALRPPSARRRFQQKDAYWLALARRDGTVVAAALYTTSGHGRELTAPVFLGTDAASRTLLLRWLAAHAEQAGSFLLTLAADDRPELWWTGIEYTDATQVAVPADGAPMARVLSLPGLQGIAAGPSSATVEVVDDPYVGGTWTLDGRCGVLEVTRGGNATATLTSHGLAGLVYGTLDPDDLLARGYGRTDQDTAASLRTLFPRACPELFSEF